MRRPLKVLFLTRYPMEGASSRYRVYQYVAHLEKLGVACDVQSFMDAHMYAVSFQPGRTVSKLAMTLSATLRRLRKLRQWRSYDLIFMQRELLPFGPPILERHLKRKGAVLIYDYDDALFIKKPSRYNPIATWARSPDKVKQLCKLVDCVTAGNDWLRDKAIEFGGKSVTVEVAEDTTRISMHAPHSNDNPVTIGWLGSRSTVKYLRTIEPTLAKIAGIHKNLRFEIVGGGSFEMENVPWTHTEWTLDGELDALARFDIGLMPLPHEEWAQGKSGGKARTYMAAGVTPVVSAVGYNLELIKDGETGFLCKTSEDWERSLASLIEDANLRQTIAEAARADVDLRFSPEKKAGQLRQIFDDLLDTERSD